MVGRLRHVRDPRGEHALLAREFLVDEIGDAVRGQAQVAGRHRMALPAEVLALDDVPQAEPHVEAPVGQAREAAHRKRIRIFLPPRREIGPAGFVEVRTRAVDHAELPAALEVGVDDRGDLLRRGVLAAKRDDCDGKLGEPDAGDFDAELAECGRDGHSADQRHHLAAAPQVLFIHES